MPLHLAMDDYSQDDWARYWLAELDNGPDGQRITGIRWDEENAEFKPCRRKQP